MSGQLEMFEFDKSTKLRENTKSTNTRYEALKGLGRIETIAYDYISSYWCMATLDDFCRVPGMNDGIWEKRLPHHFMV